MQGAPETCHPPLFLGASTAVTFTAGGPFFLHTVRAARISVAGGWDGDSHRRQVRPRRTVLAIGTVRGIPAD